MKRALKLVGGLIGLVLLAVAGFSAFVAVRGIPRYAPGQIQLTVEPTPARLARGEKLARLLCAECHMNPTTRKLTGEPVGEPWESLWDGTDDWEFTSAAHDTPEQLYAFWDDAVERSRARLDAALARGGLEQLGRVS